MINGHRFDYDHQLSISYHGRFITDYDIVIIIITNGGAMNSNPSFRSRFKLLCVVLKKGLKFELIVNWSAILTASPINSIVNMIKQRCSGTYPEF